MNYTLLVFSLFLLSTINPSICSELYTLIMTKFICYPPDPTIAHNITCKLHTNRTSQSISLYINLLPALNDITVRVVLYYKFNVYKKFLVDIKEDFCGFLNATADSKLIKIMWDEIAKVGNTNHKCPYQGYHYTQDIEFDDRLMPPLIPQGDYRLDIIAKTNILTILNNSIYFTIKPKGINNLVMG